MKKKSAFYRYHARVAVTSALALVLCRTVVWAQIDNFDSGTDANWTHLDLSAAGLPASTYSFPDDGFGGKAYRIVSPAPPSTNSGPARAFSFRTNVYSDFYLAVDLIGWDNTLNQAFGMLARAGNIGLFQTTGYAFNYNPNQFPGPAGQFQINRIDAEAPTTIAGTNVTLNPGHRYRMVGTGTASLLTGALYDIADLAHPVATLTVSDLTYGGGVSGLFNYSRTSGPAETNGVSGKADVTFDNYFCGTVNNSPRAYLRFDETNGTTAADSTGNGWTGTLVNGATFATGFSNNAVSLNGSSQYVSLPTGVAAGLTDFTIATWVKPNALSAWSRVFDFGNNTTLYMFLTPLSGSGAVRFAITTNGVEQQINAPGALPSGQWHHVAVTLSGTTGTLYVDGSPAGTNSAMTLNPASLGNTTQNWIGRSQFSVDPYLNGLVDDFRIYNGALSASDVRALATVVAPAFTSQPQSLAVPAGADATFTASVTGTAPLVYQWQLNGVNLSDNPHIGGSHSNLLTISGAQFGDEGSYALVVTNLAGPAASATVSLTVLSAGASFVPIPLTAGSYNQDMVVEKTARAPLVPGGLTTASMDAGTANTGFTWYERGFNLAALTTGLPPAGSTITNINLPDHLYRLAPSYVASNDVLMIDSANNTTGNFRLSSPASYSALSFLASAGSSIGSPLLVTYTISHSDGTQEAGTLPCFDWFIFNTGPLSNNVTVAYTANGRINPQTYAYDAVNLTNPALYSVDVALTNTSSSVTNILLRYKSGLSGSHAGIFGVSGAVAPGGPFIPITVGGYNRDVVIEASAAGALTNATTASMDTGIANTGNTWYEKGYYPASPGTGLPPAGSTFTNTSAPDRTYTLASSYTLNNVTLIDPSSQVATITPAVLNRYSALSILHATGNASPAPTIQCIIVHLDGTAETNSFTSLGWLAGSVPYAFTPSGRINLDNRIPNNVGTTNPRLYFADFNLANTNSPVTSLTVTWLGGAANSHTVIFAVSGVLLPSSPPTLTSQLQSQTVAVGTAATFTVQAAGTGPLAYEWFFNGAGLVTTTTGSLVISNTHVADGGNYQVIVSNAFGSVTSVLATLSVVTPPAIIKPPANAQVIAGNPATFAVAATSSGPLTYQWLFGDVPIPGATNFTFTISSAKLSDAGDYSVQVANLAASIVSQSAELLVLPAPAPLVPLSSYTINIQSGLNLIANQLDNGGNTLKEILPEVPDGSVVAKFDNASQTWSESSFNASLRAWVPSSITLSPGEGAFFQSLSNFTLTFTGTPHVPVLPVTIPSGTAWLVSRQTNDIGTYENITGMSPAPGAVVYKWDPAAATYTTYSYTEGGWSGGVQPTAGVGEALWIAPSGGGPVAIPVPPAITQQPISITVTQGGSATFTVAATGTEPLQYQWQLNGNNLPGATSNILTISNVQPENAGNYSVVVKNSIGIANSTVVSLSISDLVNLPFADNFADAGSLGSATTGTGTGSNAGATTEPGEPAPHFIPGGASVWLSWQPPVSGAATLSTAGSSFDTVLAVYTGSSLSNLVLVAADDDSAPFLCSLLSFDAAAATTYYIQVEGFHGATGSVVLSWNLAAAAEQAPVILIQPQGQTALPGSNVTLSVTIQVGPSVLYQWFVNNVAVPGATDSVLTLSNLDSSLVGIYEVSVTNSETLAGVVSQPASVQLIVADSGQQGSPNDVHAQDKFGNATDLTPPDPNIPRDPPPASSYTGLQTFSTVGATSDPSEPDHCGYPACGSYWLTYQAPASGLLTINTKGTSFNAILEVYTGAGTSFSTLSPVACSANHGVTAGETVTFAATGGTIYWVVIEGVNCATGNATINFFLSASPAFTLLPVSQTAASGSQVGLIANAVGAPALGYQWQFNGSNIPNATNNSLVLPSLQASNEGSYTVVATNVFGTNVSPAALVLSSNPRLLNPIVTNGVFSCQFVGVGNTNYVFQTSTDFVTWLPLTTNRSPIGLINFSDPLKTGDRGRFYRAKAQ